MSDAPTMTRDQISAAIAKKAWQDPVFHKTILTDPGKIYEEHFGRPLPAGVTLKVLEDTANTVHFVLPAKPPNAGELSDAELEQVAGGISPTVIAVSAATLFSAQIGATIGIELSGW